MASSSSSYNPYKYDAYRRRDALHKSKPTPSVSDVKPVKPVEDRQ